MAGPYYVDATNGNDANAGTAIGTPKQTIADVLADYALAAGDVIWLAPGTYRQASTLNMEASGSSGSPIIFKGDPNLSQSGWPSATDPGVVRITISDTNNQPTAYCVLDFVTYDYIEWWDCLFDGMQCTGTISGVEGGGVSATHNYLRRCVVLGGAYAAYNYINLVNCVTMGMRGAYTCNSLRSVMIGADTGGQGGTHDCSIGIGVVGGAFNNVTAMRNCTGLFSAYGINTPPANNVDNNLVIGCNYTSRGSSPNWYKLLNSYYYMVRYNAYNDSEDHSSNRIVYYNTATATTNPPVLGHCSLMYPSAIELIRAFGVIGRLWQYEDAALADGSNPTSETTDLLGMRTSTRFDSESTTRKPIGAIALSDVGHLYDSTKGNYVKIYKYGQEILHIPLKKLTATTISIKCACALGGGSTYPSITLNIPGTAFSGTTPTDSATGTSEETLSVSVDADDVIHDCVATLVLSGNETGTGAYADFYDLAVT